MTYTVEQRGETQGTEGKQTMKFDIKSRFSGAVQFSADIECDESESYSVKLGLAVRWAFKTGANLRGANLSGLILLARATRADGHEYRAWTSVLGGMVITAGCRTWQDGSVLTPGKAIEHARNHCTHQTHEAYRKEALSIIEHIERVAA